MLELRPAAERFRTVAGGSTTFHAFSFGAHYDPANTGFGLLTALNDEQLAAGAGYDAHVHRETEIVSVLLTGSLRHASEVGDAVLSSGDVQRLTAGTGVSHSETADRDPARFVQTWLRPREPGLAPGHQLVREGLGVVAEGELPALDLGTGSEARLHLGRVPAGHAVRLPGAPLRHVLVAEGRGRLRTDDGTGHRLGEADAVRVTGEDPLVLEAEQETTLLVWAMPTHG